MFICYVLHCEDYHRQANYHIHHLTELCAPPPLLLGLPWGLSGKESTCQRRRQKRLGFKPWLRKIPRRRRWQPSPVFLPGEPHGQRSLVGYSSGDSQGVGQE